MLEEYPLGKKKLLKHLDWLKKHLSEPINQLHQELGDQEIELYLVNLAARYWRVNHAIEGLKYRSLRPLAMRLRQEIEFWMAGEQWLADWFQNILQLFSSIQGTSSAVENINSILKPMIRNKKHFGSTQNTALRVPLGDGAFCGFICLMAVRLASPWGITYADLKRGNAKVKVLLIF